MAAFVAVELPVKGFPELPSCFQNSALLDSLLFCWRPKETSLASTLYSSEVALQLSNARWQWVVFIGVRKSSMAAGPVPKPPISGYRFSVLDAWMWHIHSGRLFAQWAFVSWMLAFFIRGEDAFTQPFSFLFSAPWCFVCLFTYFT